MAAYGGVFGFVTSVCFIA